MLAIGVVVGLLVPPPSAQSDAPKVQKWEQYCDTTAPKDVNAKLKAAGEEGYEIVGAFYAGGRRRPAQ